MGANTLSSVHGTAADAANGMALVEQYLVTKLLEEREFNTPLCNSAYADEQNLPKQAGSG